ncbi:hypothetical protein BC936DRAFT_137106 [Jimgerdemannia flammicorona]|uniref:Ion transport domain-containing protein n=1 Tax=Jimgerdemannia flammicorona TaxID=994334 RepID=A0A433DJ83_9FUNG|nr:hypothetical protein BC936DRAFT_137106 [Jimgerdemannia flammicorona]
MMSHTNHPNEGVRAPLLRSSSSRVSIPTDDTLPPLRDVITQVENTLAQLAPSVSDSIIPEDVVKSTLAFGGFVSVSAALQAAQGASKERAQLLAVKLVERIVREARLTDATVEVNEVLWVVLTKQSNLGKRELSALEAALQVEATTFLSSEIVSTFVNDIWNEGNQIDPNREKRPTNTTPTSGLGRLWKKVLNHLERWRTPRYQNALIIIVALVYIALYFFIVNIVEYMNNWPSVLEWIFYLFVFGEVISELQEIILNPVSHFTTLSTWFILPPTALLFSSFVFRMVALHCTSRMQMIRHLYTSYILLCFVAPFLFLRLIVWLDAFETIAKIEILIGKALRDSFWVFAMLVVTVVGFWQAVYAIEVDENVWTVLKVLVMGALYAPDFDATTRYDPIPNTLLFFTYLFLVTVVLTSLLVASFIASYLSIYPSLHGIYLLSFTRKTLAALHSGDDTGLIFPPLGNLPELIFVKPLLVLAYRSSNLHPFDTARREKWAKAYNRVREAVWILVYLPVVLLVSLAEVIYNLFDRLLGRITRFILARRSSFDGEPSAARGGRDTRDLASVLRGNPATASSTSFHHAGSTNNHYYYYNTGAGGLTTPQIPNDTLRKIFDVLDRLENRADAIERRLNGIEKQLGGAPAQDSDAEDDGDLGPEGRFEVETLQIDDY